jgi:hypothetical protein
MAGTFIPNRDEDFAQMAGQFQRTVAADEDRFGVSQDDLDALTASVSAFCEALKATQNVGTRNRSATYVKNEKRAQAERIVRRLASIVRGCDRLEAVDRLALGLRQRANKALPQSCPNEPPRLKFVRALHEAVGAAPLHRLKFSEARWDSNTKPAGAVRLELFVDLIPPDAPIPALPGVNYGGRPWYLRSYTRSPITLAPPMARVPMRVVYWGRWADSTGNVGPFSATAVAWIEGGSHHHLPGGLPTGIPGSPAPAGLLDLQTSTDPETSDNKYRVAVLDAQFQSFHPQSLTPPLQAEPRQLEGTQGIDDEEEKEAA